VCLGTSLELSIKVIVCPTRKKIYCCPSDPSKLIVLIATIATILMHLGGGVQVNGKEPHRDEEIMLTDGNLMGS
jgi:hypothetical protein